MEKKNTLLIDYNKLHGENIKYMLEFLHLLIYLGEITAVYFLNLQ